MKKLLFLLAISCQLLAISFQAKAQYTVLENFSNGNIDPAGAYPEGSLTFSVTGDTLYGMTSQGGMYGYGSIFYITANGSVYDTLYSFAAGAPHASFWDGGSPGGSLTRLGNKLYGMTSAGGLKGDGVIFTIHTDGTGFDTLHTFGEFSGDGESPQGGSLTLSVTGDTLYGMTELGGTHSDGTIFCIDTNGTGYTILHNFAAGSTDGSKPYGSLTLSVTGDTLFGMTEAGNPGNFGVLFSIKTNGTGESLFHLFGGTTGDGKNPYGNLTRSGSLLYGMTLKGGKYSSGLIFYINVNGTGYDTLHNFGSGADDGGGRPKGSLTLSNSGNILYGMTQTAGQAGAGNIFYITANGSVYDTLYTFTSADFGEPTYSSPTLSPSGGVLYGMTYFGGIPEDGSVFSDSLLIAVTATVTVNASCSQNNGIASASPSGGITPYTYSWSPGGETSSIATGLSAGTYTVTATDFLGITASATVTIIQSTTFLVTPSVSGNGCYGNASVSILGGSSPFTYSWSNGSSIVSTSNPTGAILSNGTYTVTVLDECGESATASVTFNSFPFLPVVSSTNVSCNGSSNGSASLTITPINQTFSYTGAVQNWMIPAGVTQVSIALAGGAGGVNVINGDGGGGAGASFTTGACTVTPGHVLSVVVGSAGGNCSNSNGGGGGGGGGASWIYDSTVTGAHTGTPSLSALLAVAAGGGGSEAFGNSGPGGAGGTDLIGNSTTTSINGGNGTGGTNGSGGSAGNTLNGDVTPGAGGAGWTSNGGNASPELGGNDWANSFAPATGYSNATGGFGGGGGGNNSSGGGGGGYNGGGGGTSSNSSGGGGGGGSYFNTAYGALPTNAVANNSGNGYVTISYISETTTPYTYTWSPGGQTNSTAIGLSAGTYTTTIENSCGISLTASVTITQPNALSTSAAVISNACNSTSNGNAFANPSGGTSPYTYSWSNGSTTVSTSNPTGAVLSAGNYMVTVQDSCGASATASVTIKESTVMTATASVVTPILCNAASTGSATTGVSGGTSPYTYSWSSDGGTNATINSYADSGTQVFSYEAAIQTFTVPGGITQVTITVTGAQGGGGYDSTLSPGANGASFRGVVRVTSGDVLGIVTGGEGKSGVGNVQAGGGGGGSYVWDENTTTLLAIAGGGGGAGAFSTGDATGGTNLTTSAATNSAFGNAPGGTSGNGGAAGIGGYPGPGAGGAGWFSNGGSITGIFPIIGGNDRANGFTGGAAYLNDGDGGYGGGGGAGNDAGGGGGGYNGGGGGDGSNGGGGGSYFNTAYGTLPGNVTATNTGNGSVVVSYSEFNATGGVIAGTYTVTVTDNNGCTTTASVTLTQPNVLRDSIVTASTVNITCNGTSAGSATVGVKYGTSPYTYSWSPGGGNNATAGGLSAGTYTITVQDSCGATATASVTLTQPVAVSATASIISSNVCSGGNNGDAEVFASGGTTPYTYSWSNGTTTVSTGSVLSGGTYTVTVHDNCGATATTAVIMPSSSLRGSIGSIVNVACNGAATGSAEVAATGGTSPYTYLWSPSGGTNATLSSYVITGTQTYSYEPAIQNFTVPAGITQVSITVSGAAGGYGEGTSYRGGEGASFTGVAAVTSGHVLSVVVGGIGNSGAFPAGTTGGGGGASWVYDSTAQPGHTGTPSLSSLIAVAGGGGGGSYNAIGIGGGAGGTNLTTNATTNGTTTNSAGGTGGNGGGGGQTNTGGNDPGGGGAGGAGWISNGENSSPYLGGNDWVNNFLSATGYNGANGGYGGGGGGAVNGAGGGGGYNGGGGGVYGVGGGNGGGGGSFFNTAYGSLPATVTATNTGNGSVTISYSTSSGMAGTYTVTITDNNGCNTTASVTITQPNALRDSIVTTSTVNITCSGGSTGSATVGVAYGTSPYTYSWSDGGSSATAIGLTAGTYTVTVTDNCNASLTASVTLTQPNALTVTASITSSNICTGGGNGDAEASPSGGGSPYTYSWSNGITTSSTGDVLGGGTFTVTVHDNCGTSATASIIMPAGSLRDSIIAASVVNVACKGTATGSATVGVKGGVSPYTYSWSDGGGTNAIINSYGSSGSHTFSYEPAVQNFTVPAGVTQVTVGVTGAQGGGDGGDGASFTGICTVIPGHIISVAVGGQGGTTDEGGANGGGGGSFVYDSNTVNLLAVGAGGGGNDLEDAGAGTGGTDLIANSTTTGNSSNSSNDQPGGIGGYGGSGGTVGDGPGGGGAGWLSNGSNSDDGQGGMDQANGFTGGASGGDGSEVGGYGGGGGGGLDAGGGGGGYNGGGGGNRETAGGGGGSYLNGTVVGTPTATNTGNGSVTISYSFGSPSGLAPGTYSVTVTDNNGCTAMARVTITQPGSAITPNAFTANNVSCNGGSNGQAKVSVNGGKAPYTYSWSPSTSSTYIASGLSAGTYTVTVVDNNGCNASSSTTLTQPTLLKDSVSTVTYPQCGGETASATIGVSGGTSPYRYTWSPNVSTTASATGLTIRGYVVQVKDVNGCYNDLSFSITQPPIPVLRDSIVKSATVNVSCNGSSNGSATVGVKYGTTPYTYSWSVGGGTNATINGLSVGTYSVTVNDAGGCTATASVSIGQSSSPLSSVTAFVAANVSCNGSSNGVAKVSVSGGSSPYIYSWSPGTSSTYIASGFSVGTYTVTVTDNCGSSASSSVTITQPAILSDSVITSSIVSPPCSGGGTGSAAIGVTGGTSPYRYTWSPNVSTTDSASGLTVRGYVVQVKDKNGCYNNITFNVTCSSAPATATYKGDGATCCPLSDNINLYPNPNTGQFTLSGLQQGMILEMYDYTGKMISAMTTTNESMQLNILNQADGVYLIRILDKDGNLVSEKKVVKTQ